MAASQRLIWTVIPRGINTGSSPPRLRVSVVVSPRLEHSSPNPTTLAEYPDWLDWPASLATISFDLQLSNGTLIPWSALTRVTTPSSPRWRAIFLETTPVNPYTFPAIAQLPIASYPVGSILQFSRQLYRQVAQLGLVDLPTLPEKPGQQEESLLGLIGQLTFDEETWQQLRESLRGQLQSRERAVQWNEQTPLREAIQWAKYFHEPPAARNPWNPNPSYEAAYTPFVRVPLTPPRPDFHEIHAALLNHPLLLQQLGFVLVLEFEPPAGMPATGWIQLVNLQWTPKIPTTHITPQTLYERSAMLFLPQPAPGSELQDGLLNLAGGAYGLDTLDPDSMVHKLVSFAHAVREAWQGTPAPFQSDRRLGGTAMLEESRSLGTPAPRTVGIMLYRKNAAFKLRQHLMKAISHNSTATTGGTPQLTYDDLLRGYRVDVWNSLTGGWHSITLRQATYRLLRTADELSDTDESTLTEATTSRADAEPDELRLHEGILVWKGWSLAAPRPGRVLHTEDEDNPVDPPNDPLSDYQVQGEFKVPPGTLPRLRFGHQYRFRLRAVDVAGYSRGWQEVDPTDFSRATPPIVYRRWEPVPPPVLLMRQVPDATDWRGEQLEVMAIRCYNDTDDATPTTQTSERHVAAPRGSIELAEQHGKLDTGPGGRLDPTTYTMLVQREDTLPGGSATLPSAQWTNPVTGEQVTLPVEPGAQFVVPYLPDPLARAAVFQHVPGVPPGQAWWIQPDGSLQIETIPIPRGVVIVNFGRAEDWPAVPAFRLVLAEGNAAPVWDGGNRMLTLYLPKGAEQKVLYSCALGATLTEATAALDLMALYHELAGISPHLKSLAAHGLVWMVTPHRVLTLLHAVQRPLAEPQLTSVGLSPRGYGETKAELTADISYDGKSTGKLAVAAAWETPVDNPAEDEPRDGKDGRPAPVPGKASIAELITDRPGHNVLSGQKLVHEFGDTKHRVVRYRVTAVSRFREFYPVDMGPEKFVREGPERTLSIPSSARPAVLEAVYAIPAFRWNRRSDGTTYVSERQTLTRVYIQRPWYSSGEGELVAVVLPPGSIGGGGVPRGGGVLGQFAVRLLGSPSLPETLKPYVTQWGLDPIWLSAPVPSDIAPIPALFRDTVASAQGLTLEELTGATVDVVAYEPRYDAERKLWYVDIALDPGESYFPFIRFALARYQPESIADAHLSRVTQLDFIQLLPRRMAQVVQDGSVLRILVEGHTYRAGAAVHATSEMEAVLEARVVAAPDAELGWEPVWAAPLSRMESRTPGFWVGEVRLDNLPSRYQGKSLRLVLREYEQWVADAPFGFTKPGTLPDWMGSQFTRRLVYADTIALGQAGIQIPPER